MRYVMNAKHFSALSSGNYLKETHLIKYFSLILTTKKMKTTVYFAMSFEKMCLF